LHKILLFLQEYSQKLKDLGGFRANSGENENVWTIFAEICSKSNFFRKIKKGTFVLTLIATHLVGQSSLRLAKLPVSFIRIQQTHCGASGGARQFAPPSPCGVARLKYLNTTDTLRRIWWSMAVCAAFSLRSCPSQIPEYNRHIAAHLVEHGSLRRLLLAELPVSNT
jgi:hypothetical protein